MKNLVLFAVLIGLGTFTYFYEELGSTQRKVTANQKVQLFDVKSLGKLKGFETKNLQINFIDDLPFAGEFKHLVSKEKLDEIFEIFSKVKIKRFITKEEKSRSDEKFYFPKDSPTLEFKFENSNVVFTLGNKLEFDQSFYMKVNDKTGENWVIAYDSSALDGAYSKHEFHRNDMKYRKIGAVFSLTNEYYYDTHIYPQIFYSNNFSVWKTMTIENIRNKKFSIDFESFTTDGESLVSERRDMFTYFQKKIGSLSAKKLWFKSEVLSGLLSEITLTGLQNKMLNLKLYKMKGLVEGYFLKASHSEVTFELDKKSVREFFFNAQDFKDKSIKFPKNNFNLKMKFKRQEEFFVNVAISPKSFKVKPLGESKLDAQHIEFKKLIFYLSKQASRVSEFSKLDEADFQQPLLSFSFEEDTFNVIVVNNEMIIANKLKGHKLHFPLNNGKTFSLKQSDYMR